MQNSLYIFFILGALFIVYGILGRTIERRKTVLLQHSEKRVRRALLDVFLDRFSSLVREEEKLDGKIAVLGINYTARTLTKTRISGGMLGILFSILLQNLYIVPLLFILGVTLPTTIIEAKANKRIRLYNSQILEALQIFITDFTTTQSVQKTIVDICPKLKSPLRQEFELLARRLNSGVNADEAFLMFASRTHNKWTMIFSQMMITYFRNGGDFTPHLLNITKSITDEKVLAEQNHTELSSLRLVNLAMNALVPLVFGINWAINEDAARIFTETEAGRLIILFVVISSFISLYFGKKITNY